MRPGILRFGVLLPALIAPCAAFAGTPIELRRSAAWHDTIVTMLGTNGTAAALTYMKDRFTYTDSHRLGKFLVSVERNGGLIPCSRAKDVSIEDYPGGVRTRFDLDGVKVTVEIMPLMLGRDTPEQDGAVLYSVRAAPAARIVVDVGQGTVEQDVLTGPADTASSEAGAAVLRSPGRPLVAAIVTPAGAIVRKDEKGGQYLRFTFDSGSGTILLGYAPNVDRAIAIARTAPDAARKHVEEYYERLLRCRVETPVKAINDAFRGALITLEYNWCAPFGWNESIQFWHALWHMQHTAGAEWIGQADRSRACNVTHAEHLMPDGAAPQMMQYVHTRRDFGGSNQFFCWQVRHYWEFTGDRAFAEKLAPVLDRVIAQSFAENDTDGNGLLGWGLQIGNQEDYVATPSDGTTPAIEGINMYRARRELAVGLGDEATAARCDAEIGKITARLRERLWQADLGRFLFWRDPLGVPRLDGQYHTLLYPVIWDLVDPPDAYTCLRHLRDRLTGANGEVYCSNNFPNHVGGTWGMQAGLAQQPWAAWGLAEAGLRNETWRPLAAAAGWVMDKNHRGVWPEVSAEPNPAHFSPPAGLFVAATVEALFGLHVRRPDGELLVSPSFPDHWNRASLNLPDYQAEFRRKGNTLEYVVRSREPLSRTLRWSLPPCRIREVLVDGKRQETPMLEPGVGCVFLILATEPSPESRFRITFEPLSYEVQAPASVAEGDSIDIKLKGVAVEHVDDPEGVLRGASCVEQCVCEKVRTGLLAPYRGFGRLGQLNFSRRAFLLDVHATDGPRYWLPVDLTVLPRFEAAQAGEIERWADLITIPVIVRNNASSRPSGQACLEVARTRVPFWMDLPPNAEAVFTAGLPANRAALLSPGDNRAVLTLPGDAALDVNVDAASLFRAEPALRSYAKARLRPIALPGSDLIADTDWPKLRPFHAYPHMPWAGSRPPLEALGEKGDVNVPEIVGLRFTFPARRFLPISYTMGRPSWTLPLNGQAYKKLYVLVIPFLDNHDMFAPVAQISAAAVNGGVFSRTLHFPGDLDWWSPQEVVGEFATARKPHRDRFGLLPLLKPTEGDWAEGKPPAFPQPEFWATCRTVKLASSVMSVIELDLGRATPLRSLTLSTLGVQPGLGIVGIVGETSGGGEILRGTAYEPPIELREPRVLFHLDRPGDLEGWKTEGQAFSVAAYPALQFATPTLNSLAKAGEQATGKAVSPEFVLDDRFLSFDIQGGHCEAESGPGLLCVRLVDAKSGETLHTIKPPGTHTLQRTLVPLDKWQGRTVRLEVVDENTNASYAWIGIHNVVLSAQ